MLFKSHFSSSYALFISYSHLFIVNQCKVFDWCYSANSNILFSLQRTSIVNIFFSSTCFRGFFLNKIKLKFFSIINIAYFYFNCFSFWGLFLIKYFSLSHIYFKLNSNFPHRIYMILSYNAKISTTNLFYFSSEWNNEIFISFLLAVVVFLWISFDMKSFEWVFFQRKSLHIRGSGGWTLFAMQ